MRLWLLVPVWTSACTVVVTIPGSEDSGTAPVDPCVRATVDGAGGTLVLGDVTVEVPGGALGTATDSALCPGVAPSGLVPVSDVVDLEPASLELLAPVTVTVATDGTPDAAVFARDPSGDFVHQVRFEGAPVLSGPLYHFGLVLAAVDDRVESDRTSTSQADLLVVVDSSCSMADEQQQLGTDLSSVFGVLLGSGVDYHVAATSTDVVHTCDSCQGRLHPYGGVSWVDPETTDPVTTFAGMTQMGTTGSGKEEGLAATYDALELNQDPGFRRDEATLAVVVVSDEADETARSVITTLEFIGWLSGLGPQVTFNSVVDPLLGATYLDVTEALGGVSADIHDPSWQDPLEDVVLQLVTTTVPLGAPVDPDTLAVFVIPVDGSEQRELFPPDYTLDAVRNVVTVPQGVVVPGDRIAVLYTPI